MLSDGCPHSRLVRKALRSGGSFLWKTYKVLFADRFQFVLWRRPDVIASVIPYHVTGKHRLCGSVNFDSRLLPAVPVICDGVVNEASPRRIPHDDARSGITVQGIGSENARRIPKAFDAGSVGVCEFVVRNFEGRVVQLNANREVVLLFPRDPEPFKASGPNIVRLDSDTGGPNHCLPRLLADEVHAVF